MDWCLEHANIMKCLWPEVFLFPLPDSLSIFPLLPSFPGKLVSLDLSFRLSCLWVLGLSPREIQTEVRRDEVKPFNWSILLSGHRVGSGCIPLPKGPARGVALSATPFLDPAIIQLSHYFFPYFFKLRQMVPSLLGADAPSFVDALNCAHIFVHSSFIKAP